MIPTKTSDKDNIDALYEITSILQNKFTTMIYVYIFNTSNNNIVVDITILKSSNLCRLNNLSIIFYYLWVLRLYWNPHKDYGSRMLPKKNIISNL